MEPSNVTNLQPLLQIFILTLCCFWLTLCSAIDTITIFASIKDPESIVSENKIFRLGFFSPVNTSNHRYVGIMYDIPLMTVVWVANRGKPITGSNGTVTISQGGDLVVLDGDNEIMWSSNVSSSSIANSTAQLLDSGNLILRDNSNGRILWESFQEPTDSLLQRMELGRDIKTKHNNVLKSWKSLSDPSPGTFSLGIEPLSMPQIVVWNETRTYWRSGPWNGQIFIGIRDMVPVYVEEFTVMDDRKGAASFTFSYTNFPSFTYFMIQGAGSLVQKYWEEGKDDWEIVWSAQINKCDVYGICGPFGFCNHKNSPICSCLHGFTPKHNDKWSMGKWSDGCIRKTTLQCERNNSIDEKRELDGFQKLQTVKVPDFAELSPTDEDGCASTCLSKCSCNAYVYHIGIGCMHWTQNLIDIQQFSAGGADLYIRLAYSELDHKKDIKLVIATTAIITSFSIAICGYILWKWLARHRGSNQIGGILLSRMANLDLMHPYERLSKLTNNQYKFDDLPLFDFKMLATATNDFHLANKLGQGGFGPVFKGILPGGEEIAVKRLSKSSGQGLEEFMNEVVVISRLQHRNLVRLLGCSIEKEEKMLVYEFMSNGSLDAYLFNSEKQKLLTWSQCRGIIEGIGRGLLYLHRDSRLKIIHRDLKVGNILLDEEMNPKISDFGMARIFGGNQDQADTRRVVGTYGYMAPEYAMEGRFSEKSDVYSYGVILLEIISGRRNISFYDNEQALSLVGYAWKLWNNDEMINFIDQKVYDPHCRLEILRYIQIGLLCVEENAADRPNVSTILSMMSSEIAELPSPTLPGFIGRQKSLQEEPLDSNREKSSTNDLTVTIVQGR